ncbi:MAG: insulinase family protein [Fibrella sp.]|nr:insulinase family protein [Armatimonadota bacterium]
MSRPNRKGQQQGRTGESMFVVATALIAAALVAPPPVTPVVRQVLPSGIHLLVSPRPNARLVAIEIRVRGAGSGQETSDENGLAHAVEHMLFKGTESQPAGAFDARFERMGGEAFAQTLRDGTAFRVCVLPERWKDALATWGELLQKPAFRETDWAMERIVILREMNVAQSETAKLGLQALATIAYAPNDSYSRPLMGSRANVERFTANDLRAFHTKRYQPANLTVAVSGPVTAEEVKSVVSGQWSVVSGTVAPSPIPPRTADYAPPTTNAPLRAPLFTDDEQTARKLATVYLGFHAPRLQTDPSNAAACDVLATLLARGLGGILGDRLTGDRKLNTTSVYAEYLPQADRALFVIHATGEKRDIGQIEDAIIAELETLKARFANGDASLEDLLEGAKSATIGEAEYPRQTVEGEAKYLAYLDMLNAPDGYAEKYAERVRAVSVADMSRLLENYVTPPKRRVAVIGLSAIGAAASAPAFSEAEAVK